MPPIANSLIDLIGNTPLLALERFAKGATATVLAKLEMFNPLSIKDRPVLSMLRGAEERGELSPGGLIVEATSGNTGMALAYIARLLGYRVRLYMSEAQSIERRKVLAALGAELVLTPAAEGTRGAKERAIAFVESSPGAFYLCQHHNPDNPKAHFSTTGPEIWEDTGGNLDIFVAGLGTCGTISGTTRFLREKNPELHVVGMEPEGASLLGEGTWQPHGIMGVSPGFRPDNYDESLVDEIVTVTTEQAYQACRELASAEGLLVGISSGAVAHAARAVAQRPALAGKRVVCVFADSGERYLSVPGLFADQDSGRGPSK